MTRPRLATLALSLVALSGCAGPNASLQSAHRLEAPARARTWAFSPSAPAPDLDAARPAVRAGLGRAGWLEAPPEQAEFLVQVSLRLGDAHLQRLDTPVLDLLRVTVDLAAPSPGRSPGPEPSRPEAVHYTKRLELIIGRRDGGQVVYAGQAVVNDTSPFAGAAGVALARALLEPFPGRPRESWSDRLPVEAEFPSPPGLPPQAALAPAPVTPPSTRAVCVDAVPVLVGPALVRRIPSQAGDVAFRLDGSAPGCARDTARGQVRVVLADGRSGYVPGEAVRYDPAR